MPRPKKAGRPKQSILDGDEDAGPSGIDTLTVNKEYARRFQHNKERDDLHRLKELQKAGLAGEASSDSEDDESEDEDGLLPRETEAQIFETLKRIRQKDPSIYQKDVTFFKEGEEGGTSIEKGQKKQKAVYLKDVMARQLLEGGGDDEEDERVGLKRKGKTYAEEQQELKDEFLRGVTKVESEDEEADDLLRVRKGPSEAATSVLAGAPPSKDAEIMARLEAYFGKDEALDEGERFLKDYLANKKWVDQERDRVPTYGEIVDEHPDVSEDEEEVERQEEFEKKYNFRFEEPGSWHVVGHSRVVEGSVRRPDDARWV
jgi:protein KRI1